MEQSKKQLEQKQQNESIKHSEKGVKMKSFFENSLTTIYLSEHEMIAEDCVVLSNN